MEKKLQNDISIKDGGRLINAGFKLTPDTEEIKFSFDTKAIPTMMCGVEETPTFSQVELITSIRDNQGNNRLCVDDAGSLPVFSKSQAGYNFANNALQATPFPFMLVPEGKHLYITGICYGNNQAATKQLALIEDKHGSINGFGNVILEPNKTIVLAGGIIYTVSPLSTLYLDDGGTNLTYILNIWGFIQ